MFKNYITFLLLVIFSSPALCSPCDPSALFLQQTAFTENAIVRLPKTYNASNNVPLIIVYSGAGFSASMTERDTNLTPVATGKGYAVAYINHITPDTSDNFNQAANIVTKIQKLWRINPHRIFLMGHSDGGSMVQLIALKRLVNVTGIAASASGLRHSSLHEALCLNPPTPSLILHSNDDEMFPTKEGYGKKVSQWFARCAHSKLKKQRDGFGCSVYDSSLPLKSVKYCSYNGAHNTWPTQHNKLILTFFEQY